MPSKPVDYEVRRARDGERAIVHLRSFHAGMLSDMSTKTICDGCGNEIKAWDPKDPKLTDGLARMLTIGTGNNHERWDLCDACQGRIANAIVEILPYKSREIWFDAIRPTKPA